MAKLVVLFLVVVAACYGAPPPQPEDNQTGTGISGGFHRAKQYVEGELNQLVERTAAKTLSILSSVGIPRLRRHLVGGLGDYGHGGGGFGGGYGHGHQGQGGLGAVGVPVGQSYSKSSASASSSSGGAVLG